MTQKLMGRKKGMFQRFNDKGLFDVCSVIHVEPNVVTQIKNMETDGYEAVQIGFEKVEAKDPRRKEARTSKPLRGHFAKNKIDPRKHLFEFRSEETSQFEVGQELNVEFFESIGYVDVTGVSKGKGFQGVVKKFGFAGGPASHGSDFHRRPGSIGMRSTPGRCFPGAKRASRLGGRTATVQSLKVIAIDKDRNLLIVKGAVPGCCGSLVTISQAKKIKPKGS